MKIKSIFATALALCMFSACNKDEVDDQAPEFSDGAVAYLSVNIQKQVETRATVPGSDDKVGSSEEGEIKSVYLFTFDGLGNLLGIPGTSNYYIILNSTPAPTDVQRVSANSVNLLAIANPGTKLKNVINGVGAYTTYTTLNKAIQSVQEDEIIDLASPVTKGFTMITSGEQGAKTPGQTIDNGLVAIGNKIKKLTDPAYTTEQDAKDAAAADLLLVNIERLAAKVEFKVKTPLEVKPVADGASFDLTSGGWLLDAVNTEFYPYAKKHILSVTYNGSFYSNNFYTEDPNYIPSPLGAGLDKVTVDNNTFMPVFRGAGLIWKGGGTSTYQIENTMAPNEQKYGNATRLVVKGTYYPKTGWSGDWFSYGGENYETLAELQTDYSNSAAGSNLRQACDDMFNRIKAYAEDPVNAGLGITLVATNFATLDQTADLDQIPNKLGGEIIKTPKNSPFGCIRWYQGGQSYYYNEIKHDHDTNVLMALGKYGIVRNNWYELTLATVNGAGTPWYPDIDNPGPGDPNPVDPIDEDAGYLGLDIKVAPWIFWQREIDI